MSQFKFKGLDYNKLRKEGEWSCNRFILNNNPRDSQVAPFNFGGCIYIFDTT